LVAETVLNFLLTFAGGDGCCFLSAKLLGEGVAAALRRFEFLFASEGEVAIQLSAGVEAVGEAGGSGGAEGAFGSAAVLIAGITGDAGDDFSVLDRATNLFLSLRKSLEFIIESLMVGM